jgi:tetratricopeptide (TPR) repeat protein
VIALADAQLRAGNLHKSLALYREALHIAEAFGAGDIHLAATMDYLGNVYSALGSWPESERQFRRALPMVEAVAGRESVTYGLVLLDLGNMYGNSGRLERAEAPLREALATLTKVLPANDSRVAIVRSSYAAVLIYGKRYREAEDLVRQAIGTLEKQPNQPCIALASSYNILGLAIWRQGRYEDALPVQQHAVQTGEGCLGPYNPELTQLLNNLAITYSDLHKNADSEAAFLRAISLCEKEACADHPRYGKLLLNYADFLRRNHRKSEANKVAARSQAALREIARRNGAGLTVDVSAFQPQR